MKPTIVLVHGAFAESANWNGVIRRLHTAGHRVIAAGNPLRTLTGDAAAVADLLDSIKGPVVLAESDRRPARVPRSARTTVFIHADCSLIAPPRAARRI